MRAYRIRSPVRPSHGEMATRSRPCGRFAGRISQNRLARDRPPLPFTEAFSRKELGTQVAHASIRTRLSTELHRVGVGLTIEVWGVMAVAGATHKRVLESTPPYNTGLRSRRWLQFTVKFAKPVN